MLEHPECHVIADQMNQTIRGKTVRNVYAGLSPHKFAFFTGDPALYHGFISGKMIGPTRAIGPMMETEIGDYRLLMGDGVNVRFFGPQDKLPAKIQLQLEFEDSSFLVCTVQMYGGMWLFRPGENDSVYYAAAVEKPSPLTKEFSEDYFMDLCRDAKQNLSAKAFLATEQRIPGLGNGVLQDILFRARLHPKTKLETLPEERRKELHRIVKDTLFEMTAKGGRDTEKDLFGASGGYQTILSSKTVSQPCPVCGGDIVKQPYLGGSVYFCPQCQPLDR